MDERLARQRAKTYRYWREDVSARPGPPVDGPAFRADAAGDVATVQRVRGAGLRHALPFRIWVPTD